MSVLSAYVFVHLWRSEEGMGSPRIGVTQGYGLFCECFELTLSPLQEQQILLTAKPSLQPPEY